MRTSTVVFCIVILCAFALSNVETGEPDKHESTNYNGESDGQDGKGEGGTGSAGHDEKGQEGKNNNNGHDGKGEGVRDDDGKDGKGEEGKGGNGNGQDSKGEGEEDGNKHDGKGEVGKSSDGQDGKEDEKNSGKGQDGKDEEEKCSNGQNGRGEGGQAGQDQDGKGEGGKDGEGQDGKGQGGQGQDGKGQRGQGGEDHEDTTQGGQGGQRQDGKGQGGQGQDGKEQGRKSNLTFVYNTNLGDYFYNADSETAFVLNLLSNHTGFFNGKTGEAFIVSSNNQSSVYLPSSDQTWNANKESLEDYADNTSLEVVFNYGLDNGLEINSRTIDDELKEKILDITSTLNSVNSKTSDGYSYLLETSILSLTRQLNELRPAFRGTKTPVNGDLSCGLEVLRGVDCFFAGFKDISEIKSNPGLVNLDEILSSDSGLEALSSLLNDVAPTINLQENLSDESKTNFIWLFDIIAKLSGNDYYDFNGFVRVVMNMVKYASDSISEEEMRHILELYFTSGSEKNPNLENKWKESVENLKNTFDELQLSSVFEYFSDALAKIIKNNWKVNNINMSDAIHGLIYADFDEECVDNIMSKLCKEN